MSSTGPTRNRTRREPPAYPRVTVRAVTPLTPRLIRVTVAGPELKGLLVEQPAASVRLLLPSPGSNELVMPAWNGNEFLLPDGSRPAIRTLTPLRLDADAHRLDLEIVVHEGGAVSAWALAAEEGDEVAISGPGRGYPIDPDASGFLLGGDESAIPAIGQLLEALPGDKPVQVLVEVAHPDARLELPPVPAPPCSGSTCPPAPRPATPSWPPSPKPTSPRASGCGAPARPPPCSASAATSLTSEISRGPRPGSGATGKPVAPEPTTTTSSLLGTCAACSG